VVVAEILVALVAVDTLGIGKPEHDTLLRFHVLPLTALKMWK
jgi:hypothetical protein